MDYAKHKTTSSWGLLDWLIEVLCVKFSHYMCQRGFYNASCNAPPQVSSRTGQNSATQLPKLKRKKGKKQELVFWSEKNGVSKVMFKVWSPHENRRDNKIIWYLWVILNFCVQVENICQTHHVKGINENCSSPLQKAKKE
jgi:hypothetical protein